MNTTEILGMLDKLYTDDGQLIIPLVTVKQLFEIDRNRVLRWSPSNWQYQDMGKSITFSIEGSFRLRVNIFLNRMDLYDISFFDPTGKRIKLYKDVYFDQMVSVINGFLMKENP
jgi:hypothetical protein